MIEGLGHIISIEMESADVNLTIYQISSATISGSFWHDLSHLMVYLHVKSHNIQVSGGKIITMDKRCAKATAKHTPD